MKILGFYISRTDWEDIYNNTDAFLKLETNEKIITLSSKVNKLESDIMYYKHYNNALQSKLADAKETYAGKDGRLRYKHNGQFAPDNRTKFKQTHDQLRAEVAYNKSLDYSELQPSDTFLSGNYDEIKKASKLEGFGR